MSGTRVRWPRHMRRRFGPPQGAWYCCGGRLMRSMADPQEAGVQLHQCPRCGIAIRARGAELLATIWPQSPADSPPVAERQLTLFDLPTTRNSH